MYHGGIIGRDYCEGLLREGEGLLREGLLRDFEGLLRRDYCGGIIARGIIARDYCGALLHFSRMSIKGFQVGP